MPTATLSNRLAMIRTELPSFGKLLRRRRRLRSAHLEACLARQMREGGRLGEILLRQGLITRAHIRETLREQAFWVAGAVQNHWAVPVFPQRQFLSLCLPAYNEEGNIADTLDGALAVLPEFVQRFEIVVVNDGSTDRTAETVEGYAQKHPGVVRLISHPTNRGYGAALSSGLKAAQGDLVAFTDSDGQFSLLDLPAFLAQAHSADVVAGFRHLRADPWYRRFNGKGWTWLVRTLLGVRLRDLDCAFKLFHRHVIDRLQMTAHGAAINAEIMAQCQRADLRIVELPVAHYKRAHGVQTGAALPVILKAFRELPRLWKYRSSVPPGYTEIEAARAEESGRVEVVLPKG